MLAYSGEQAAWDLSPFSSVLHNGKDVYSS